MATVNSLKVGIAVALGSLAVLTAAPAGADDETYLEVLEMMEIPVADPSAAVALGRAVCAGLDQGQSVEAVANAIGTANGLTLDQSGMVVGASVAAYCDQHRALVGG
ncbi:DUF732 domain-containing protein [Mycobacterium sp. smrl_JER01]|uniref:DUF732 domain-containing protein n=1 Tax=Mycobacterium sp. smrl_JER01 TaxID=3402633 RepID=UPI003AC9E691